MRLVLDAAGGMWKRPPFLFMYRVTMVAVEEVLFNCFIFSSQLVHSNYC